MRNQIVVGKRAHDHSRELQALQVSLEQVQYACYSWKTPPLELEQVLAIVVCQAARGQAKSARNWACSQAI
jgi:hypothetical protein